MEKKLKQPFLFHLKYKKKNTKKKERTTMSNEKELKEENNLISAPTWKESFLKAQTAYVYLLIT